MSYEHLKTALKSMDNSGQSEAKVIAEVIIDSLDGCDDDPVVMANAIADEFIGWANSIKFACGTLGEKS